MRSQKSALDSRPVPRRKVVLLAGPSGSGKGRVGEYSGLPVLNLDDFYRDLDEPGLPRAFGIVDWDNPASWNQQAALSALERLCFEDTCTTPIYSISTSLRTGERVFSATGAPMLIAEGIFAAELVAPLRERGLLTDAIVLDRPAPLVFALRFVRDVRQARKPIVTLIRRGAALARSQGSDIERWASAGMRRYGLRAALRRVRELAALGEADARATDVGPSPGHTRHSRTITVSAVCFSTFQAAGPGFPHGQWLALGVRKKGTQKFMQPGGKPEAGESPLECAVREIKEELDITLDPATLTLLGEFTTAAANEQGYTLHSTVFLAPEVHNPHDFEPRAEIEELRWIPIDDVPENVELAPLFSSEVLPRLREQLR